MAYEKINWKDYPSIATPITADNLNHMDEGISNLSEQMDDIDPITTTEIDEIMGSTTGGDYEEIDADEITNEDIDSLF